MKKIYTFFTFILFTSLGFGQWNVYTADVLPIADGWGVNDSLPGPQNNESIVVVDDFTVLNFYSPNTYDPTGTKDNARMTFKKGFGENQGSITVLARTKGYSQEDYLFDSIGTILELGFRPTTTGNRDLMTVNYVTGEGGYTTEVNLKRVDQTYAIPDDDWHTYRVTMVAESGLFEVYLDEDPTPVITGNSTKSGHDDNEMRLGDEAGATVGGYIDWIAWNVSGTYAPGQGDPLPDNIFVDGRDDQVSVGEIGKDLFKVYPNPVRDYLNISSDYPDTEIALYDITGKQMMFKKMYSTRETLNMNFLPSGLYFITLRNESGMQTGKLIKK